MRYCAIIVNEEQVERAKILLEDSNINYREAGYPDGSVEVKESYPSKINLHADLEKYARLKGYDSVVKAIGKMGGGRSFKMSFDKEFKTMNQ